MSLRLALTFAFALTAGSAPAQPPVTAEVRAIHDRLLVLDTHFDTTANLARAGWDVTQRHAYAEDFTQVDLPRLIEGGVDGGFWTIFVPQGPRTAEGHAVARDTALQIAQHIHSMVAAHPDRFALALTADDAAPIAATGRSVVYLSIENAYPISHDLTLLRTFYQLGVRVLGLTHFANNDLADSATDPKGPEWHGLSPLGRQLVAEANRLGLVLDASHSSDDVLDQLLALSTAPILLSHSGCKAVYNHPRNIDDIRLRALAAQGGVIQLNAYSTYVANLPVPAERSVAQRDLFVRIGGRERLATPEGYAAYLAARREFEQKHPKPLASFDAFIAHVLHALKIVGPDHVGISGDFDGGGGVEGFNDPTGAPRITAAVLAAGYTENDLEKIWSGNALRVLRAAESARQPPVPLSSPNS